MPPKTNFPSVVSKVALMVLMPGTPGKPNSSLKSKLEPSEDSSRMKKFDPNPAGGKPAMEPVEGKSVEVEFARMNRSPEESTPTGVALSYRLPSR